MNKSSINTIRYNGNKIYTCYLLHKDLSTICYILHAFDIANCIYLKLHVYRIRDVFLSINSCLCDDHCKEHATLALASFCLACVRATAFPTDLNENFLLSWPTAASGLVADILQFMFSVDWLL